MRNLPIHYRRMKLIYAAMFFILPMLASGLAHADAADDGMLRAFWENDGALHDPTDGHDGHYTNGTAVAWLGRPLWADKVGENLPFADLAGNRATATQTGAGLIAGQLIMTPRDITSVAPIVNDMPFAGYAYVGVFWQRESAFAASPGVRTLEHVQLDLGVVGPSAKGYQVQKYVHDHFVGRKNPGWRNQIQDEFAAQLYLRRKWCLNQDVLGGAHHRDYLWQVIPESTLALGTVYDHLEVGVETRFGVNLPHDFGSPRLTDPGTPEALPQGSSFYVYARGAGRVVAHNLFVDGSLFHNAPTSAGSAIQGSPWRLDGTLGLRWTGKWGNTSVEFGYSLTFMTDQFKQQKGLDSMGAFQLGVTTKF